VSRPCWSPIVELRRYTLHPGQREVLIELFDRELVETQEAVGMKVIGQFRDLDDPDQFVWLRGFPDMESRARSLAAFYGGPVWKAHREAANATMIDSDNVLLLRPARDGTAFALNGERGSRGGFVLAVVMPLERASSFDGGGAALGSFVTGLRFVCRLRGSRRSRSRGRAPRRSCRGRIATRTDVEVVTRRMKRKERR
jgi:hypothetical protein